VNVGGFGKEEVWEFGEGREKRYNNADVVSEM
jgi:hypothetical protein